MGDATHICGLDHIPYINSLCGNNIKSKSSILKKIADGTLKYSSFPVSDQDSFTSEIPKTFNPLSQKPYTLEDRIKTLIDLVPLLENAYKGKFFDWKVNYQGIKTPDNKYRNVGISADYMLAIPTGIANENLYIFMYCDRNNPNHLRIHSAFPDGVDLSQGQERPYTILSEEKVNTKTKQTTQLYTHPSSGSPNTGSPNVMKMTFNSPSTDQLDLNGNGTAVLTAPRQTFGQAISSFVKGIADKVKERIERRRNKPNSDLEDPRPGTVQKQTESAPLKSELQELSDENAPPIEQKNKPLVKAATKSTKSFAQGLDELAKRHSGQGSKTSLTHKNTDHKHRK